MIGVFSGRGFILAWVIVIAIGAQSNLVLAFLERLRASKLQSNLQQTADGLKDIPPQVIQYLLATFNLDVRIVSSSGTIQLTTVVFLAVLTLVFLIAAYIILGKAIKSKNFLDDFVALGVFYVALQVMIGIWTQAARFSEQVGDNAIAVIMTIVIAFLTRKAFGYYESKIFFRGLILVFLVWAFVMPERVFGGTLNLFEEFARACARLWPEPQPLAQAVAAFAGIVALGQLYEVGKKPKPPAGPIIDAMKTKIEEAIDEAKKKL